MTGLVAMEIIMVIIVVIEYGHNIHSVKIGFTVILMMNVKFV